MSISCKRQAWCTLSNPGMLGPNKDLGLAYGPAAAGSNIPHPAGTTDRTVVGRWARPSRRSWPPILLMPPSPSQLWTSQHGIQAVLGVETWPFWYAFSYIWSLEASRPS